MNRKESYSHSVVHGAPNPRVPGVALGQRTVQILALGFLSICFLPLAHGEDVVLTFTVPLELKVAAGSVSVWLNALNSSSNQVTWTFPRQIESRIVSSQGAFNGTLELRSAESGLVAIPPGGFIRQEYLLPVPDSVTGQAVIEFPKLNANRVVLNIQPSPPIASRTDNGKSSAFTTLIKEVEPAGPGEGFDPGRFFKEHISGYEPFYFIGGTKSPNVKFQISFKYQLLNSEGTLAEKAPVLKGFHIAYTQTSLWNLNGPSPAFYDTSYKPELLYLWNRVAGGKPDDWLRLDLQAGLQHESNGRGGEDERSLNNVYLRPTLTLGRNDGLQLTLQPQAWVYVGGLPDNPDLPDYRGYVSLRTIVGWQRGLQLSALGRMGNEANHGSLQLDLTYPTMRFFGSFSLYLDVQFFTGYGESLLAYNRTTDELRVGFSLYR